MIRSNSGVDGESGRVLGYGEHPPVDLANCKRIQRSVDQKTKTKDNRVIATRTPQWLSS